MKIKKYNQIIVPILVYFISIIIGIFSKNTFVGMIVLITGILNSYYSSVGNKINFPIGVINNLALSYVAFKNNNYGLVIFNLLFFMPINIKGYFEWNKNSNKDVVKNDPKKLLETLTEICFSQYQMRLNKDIDHEKIVNYERSVLLGVIDYTWINHIDAMTKLRNGIYLRAYAQKNPLSEYTEEAFYMFEQMKLSIVDMISKNIVHMGIRPGSSAEESIPHLKLEVEFK